jgi:uncharacterized alkaline shock family protein YloU
VGTIIAEPTIEANLSKGVSTVRVFARDPKTKQFVEAIVSGKSSDIISLGQADEMGDEDGADDPVSERLTRTERVHAGYLAQAAANALAQARFRETAIGRYKMGISVVGDATIAAKQLVEVYGVSATTDGLYYAKEVSHRIGDGGYTAELKLQKDAQREVDLAARVKARVNAYARQARPKSRVRNLTKTLEVRYGPNDEVIPTWTYLDADSKPVGKYADLTQEELFALSERELGFLARVGAQSQLPDA